MRITCPYCHSEARLRPNPAPADGVTSPRYELECSGCNATSVRPHPGRRQPRCSADGTFIPESLARASAG